MHPKVYIVLVNYNGWKDTIECLESVFRSDYPNFQVVVVDNLSADNSMTHILSWAKGDKYAGFENPQLARLTRPQITKPIECVFYNTQALFSSVSFNERNSNNPLVLIQSGENKGFAAGNNAGINYSFAKNDADYIWLLNNDTVVESGALRALVEKAIFYKENQQRVGIIGAKLLYYNDPNMIQGVAGIYNKWFAISKHLGIFEDDHGQYDNEAIAGKMDYSIGASLFVSAPFIKGVGLMCEDYFLYFEDIDWAVRGKAKGWHLGYCWQARVFHKEGNSTGACYQKPFGKSAIADFHSIRNRILFTNKFYPIHLWTVKLSFIAVIINRLRRRQFDRVLSVINLIITKKKHNE